MKVRQMMHALILLGLLGGLAACTDGSTDGCDETVGDLGPVADLLGLPAEAETVGDVFLAIVREMRGTQIRWLNPRHVFRQGEVAVVILRAFPLTCFGVPDIVYASGHHSTAHNLTERCANDEGIVYWVWRIDDDTDVGAARFTVNADGLDEPVIVRFEVRS